MRRFWRESSPTNRFFMNFMKNEIKNNGILRRNNEMRSETVETVGANRLAQSWPYADASHGAGKQIFDTIFSNHANLSDFECHFKSDVEKNWFRSCQVPLERFAVNKLWDDQATLVTLENCCKDSLKSIKFGQRDLNFNADSQSNHRVFSPLTICIRFPSSQLFSMQQISLPSFHHPSRRFLSK